MRAFITILTIVFACISGIGNAESADRTMERDESLLRSTFEEPLKIELQKKGLTPRNADISARHTLDALIECWKSERNTPTSSEEKTVVVRLGGKAIVTYATPCMDEFIARVGELSR